MSTLFSGQCLQSEQSLQSNNRLYKLIMQLDGNVVLYDQHSQPIWATNTNGIKPRDFVMQTDGNLVFYDETGSPKWASHTDNHAGAFLNVQDDGNLVVYRAGSQTETANNALWASGSNHKSAQSEHKPAQEGKNASMAQEILNAHNSYRSQVGVPPLAWSDDLARDAHERAKLLSDTGKFEHLGNAKGEGENLWKGTSGAYSFAHMIDSFGKEQHYNDGHNYNHYTQMVWRKSTHLGCGVVDNGRDTILVCRYSPVGNMVGEKAY